MAEHDYQPIEKYLIDNEGTLIILTLLIFFKSSMWYTKDQTNKLNRLASDDKLRHLEFKDEVEQIDQKVEGILNQTQGLVTH